MKIYIVERTNKAEKKNKREEQSEKAENCWEDYGIKYS